MGEREGAKEVKAHPARGDRAVPRGGGSLCHQGCGGGQRTIHGGAGGRS